MGVRICRLSPSVDFDEFLKSIFGGARLAFFQVSDLQSKPSNPEWITRAALTINHAGYDRKWFAAIRAVISGLQIEFSARWALRALRDKVSATVGAVEIALATSD